MADDALQSEIAFLSGFESDGTLSPTSFATWNQDAPATYSTQAQQFKWGQNTAGTPGGTVTYGFDPGSDFSAAEQRVFEAGLALWSDEADISFAPARPDQTPDVTFERNSTFDAYENDDTPTTTVGASVVPHPSDVIVTIDTRSSAYGPLDQPFAFQAYPLSTVVHEEGHVLGLGHTGPYNGGTQQSSDAAQFGIYDSQLYSVMSYIPPNDPNAAFADQYSAHAKFPNAETPMVDDILAAQRLYGAPTSTALSGGQTFGFNCNITDGTQLFFDFSINTKPAVTLYDTGTGNTLDLSGFSQGSNTNITPGAYTSCAGETDNVVIAPGTVIDRVITGAGNDTITGNTGNDTIVGGAGNDILTGGGGHDVFVFKPGSGQDQIVDFSAFGLSNRVQFRPLFASKNDPPISRVNLAEKATTGRSRDVVWGGRG